MSSNTLSLIPAFTPTQISGCTLWLDAKDTTTLSLSGSTITQWRDKSGLGNNPTFTNNPSYVSGSTPYVTTRNLNQQFSVPASVNATTSGQSGCLFIVYADTKANAQYQALFAATSGFFQALYRIDSASYCFVNVTNSTLTNYVNSTATLIYGVSYTNNSSSFTLRTNGNTISFPSPPTVIPSGAMVISGTSWGVLDEANLNIYEII